jgi:NAD-dependent histone deacetylase SIR2
VLYDEPHPLGEDIGVIQSADVARKPDMLIIMGTSLKVHGLKKLVKDFAKAVHLSASATTGKAKSWAGKVVFVNRTPPTSEWDGIIDYHVEGYTDIWVEKVLNDWKKMKPTDWEIQQTLDGKNGTLMVTKGVKVKLPSEVFRGILTHWLIPTKHRKRKRFRTPKILVAARSN